jgi:hypothetical protein
MNMMREGIILGHIFNQALQAILQHPRPILASKLSSDDILKQALL